MSRNIIFAQNLSCELLLGPVVLDLKSFSFSFLRLYNTVHTEEIGLTATLSTCIFEVFVSNNYRDIVYIEGFLFIPRSLPTNVCIAPTIRQDRFLPNSFQLIIRLSNDMTLYNVATDVIK
jgi:hypothetical protein